MLLTQTKWIRIVNVVFKPKAVPKLGIGKLFGNDAAESGSNDSTREWGLGNPTSEQVYVVHMAGKHMIYLYQLTQAMLHILLSGSGFFVQCCSNDCLTKLIN